MGYKKCCVPDCRNAYSTNNGNQTYFSFPKEYVVYQKWLSAIRCNKDFAPKMHSRVCGIHFEDDDFEDDSYFISPRPRLKRSAIPWIFPGRCHRDQYHSEMKLYRIAIQETMDTEALIAKVYARRPIWDKFHALHANRNLLEKLWKEISSEMKTDENSLRKKWKYLRDQYGVETGKLRSARGGDNQNGEYSTSKWLYFQKLTFLKDIVKMRFTTTAPNRTESISMEDFYTGASGEAEQSQVPASDQSEDSSDPIRRSTFNFAEVLSDASNEKRAKYSSERTTRREQEFDEDEMFFKSLLPHVRKIHASKKMLFRIRIQQIVDEFAYKQRASIGYTASSSGYADESAESYQHQSAAVENDGGIKIEHE